MSTRMIVTAGVCAAALLAGAGFAMNARDGGRIAAEASKNAPSAPAALVEAETAQSVTLDAAGEPQAPAPIEPIVIAATPKSDCRDVASSQTGFNPATTPYPVREDVRNRQVLKGAAVGAAAGAIGGELIADRAGKGAAVGAAAGAIGGLAIKKSKQRAADERFEQEIAAYHQSKSAFDAALQTCLAG